MNKFRIFLYYSGLVDMKATETRDAVKGVSMEFPFYGEHGEQVEPTVSADGVSGTRRGKSFLSEDKLHKVSYVPGIYDGTFELTVGSDGKPVLKLVDVDFVGAAVISLKDGGNGNGKGDK